MMQYGFFAATIVALDYATKRWALSHCVNEVVYNKFFSCQVLFNRGIAWSFFHSDSSLIFGLVTACIILVMVGMAFYTVMQLRSGEPIWGEAMVLAGALGNVVDRFLYHGVVDFIAIGYENFSWPLFNGADIAIFCGVMIMFFGYRR